MIAATARHILLLMTCRHPLTGLGHKSYPVVAVTLVVAGLIAWLRWGEFSTGVGFVGVLALMASTGNVRMAVAWALLFIVWRDTQLTRRGVL